jgi:hypothetical protein
MRYRGLERADVAQSVEHQLPKLSPPFAALLTGFRPLAPRAGLKAILSLSVRAALGPFSTVAVSTVLAPGVAA